MADTQPFQRRTETPHTGWPIRSLFHVKKTKGDIGIEVECEGNKFPKTGHYDNGGDQHIPKQWKYTHDGSLRGKDNAEYVLRTPIKFDQVPSAVNDLWRMFEDYGTKLDDSNRTSVHVHLNCQEWHLNRLAAFIGLYYSVEEILTAWCGVNREGNMFCLRAKDAAGIVTRIKLMIQTENPEYISEGLHYAGLNPHALRKYGSLEVRSLRGVTEPEPIITWAGILQRLYEMSGEFKDPRNVIDNFSGAGTDEYLSSVLGPYLQEIRSSLPMTDQEVMDSVYNGIRLAQDICYCRDWAKYEPTEAKQDPFGRERVKPPPGLTTHTMQSYMAQMQEQIMTQSAGTQSTTAADPNDWVMQAFSEPPAPAPPQVPTQVNPPPAPVEPDMMDYEDEDDYMMDYAQWEMDMDSWMEMYGDA